MLGGSSIDIIGLATQLQDELGICLTIKDFYIHKTIKALSDNLIGKDQKHTKVSKTTTTTTLPLLPNQLSFFERKSHLNTHVNTFSIVTPALNVDKLKECIDRLVSRHYVFKVKFVKKKKKYRHCL